MAVPPITPEWTLFLDRDGVINVDNPGGYVKNLEEFEFFAGALDALRIFGERFKHVLVVTNQRGVGRGIVKPEDLARMHEHMLAAVRAARGRIDHIYFCTDVEESSPCRKPNPGMGLAAARDFPAIDLSRSIMVGNNLSDMEFGRNLGAKTVFLPTTNLEVTADDPRVDAIYPSLFAFAQSL